jgi:hypothetical protein
MTDDSHQGDEPGVPDTDPETIDPAGHMADLDLVDVVEGDRAASTGRS